MTNDSPPTPELLTLLRCPLTRQPLRRLSEEEATQLGWAHGGLIRADGTLAYPIDEHGFPHLVPEAGSPVPCAGA